MEINVLSLLTTLLFSYFNTLHFTWGSHLVLQFSLGEFAYVCYTSAHPLIEVLCKDSCLFSNFIATNAVFFWQVQLCGQRRFIPEWSGDHTTLLWFNNVWMKWRMEWLSMQWRRLLVFQGQPSCTTWRDVGWCPLLTVMAWEDTLLSLHRSNQC